MRIHHLHVEHCIDAHLHIIARDADLLGDVDGDFLQAMPVGDLLDEWNQDVKPGLQGAAVLAQVLHHERTLLRHHRGRLEYGDDDQYGRHYEYVAD